MLNLLKVELISLLMSLNKENNDRYEETLKRIVNIENKWNRNDNKLQSLSKTIEEQLLNNNIKFESIKTSQNEFEVKYFQLIEKHEDFKNALENIKDDFDSKAREIDRIIKPISTKINDFDEKQK